MPTVALSNRRGTIRRLPIAVAALALALMPSAISAAGVPSPRPATLLGKPALGPLQSLSAMAFASGQVGAVGGQACEDNVSAHCHGLVAVTADAGRTWTMSNVSGYKAAALWYTPSGTLWAEVQVMAACPTQSPSCKTELRTEPKPGGPWTTRLTTDRTVSAFAAGPGGRAWVAVSACRASTTRIPACNTSTVLATANAGRTWRTASGHQPWIADLVLRQGTLWALAAANRGQRGLVLAMASTDGGRTFRTVGTLLDQMYMGAAGRVTGELAPGRGGAMWAAFEDMDSCAMHGCSVDGIYRSTDGGRAWQALPWPRSTGGCPIGTPALAAYAGRVLATESHNLAACAPPATNLLAVPARSGVPSVIHEWSLTFVQALALTSPTQAWSLTPGGLLESADGGRTWHAVWPAPLPQASIDVVAPDLAYGAGTVGDSAAVLRSVDGGAVWQVVASLPLYQVTAVSFVDGRHGYLVGEGSFQGSYSLWRTDDGGRAWRRIRRLPKGQALALRFTSALRGGLVLQSWAAGGRISLLETTDAGRHFHTVVTMPYEVAKGSVESVALAGPASALVTVSGSGGDTEVVRLAPHDRGRETLLKVAGTSGYGTLLATPTGDVAAVAVTLTYHPAPGWGNAEQAEILVRSRGGVWKNWRLPKTAGTVEALYFSSTLDGWAVTGSGPYETGGAALWHTSDGGATWTLAAS